MLCVENHVIVTITITAAGQSPGIRGGCPWMTVPKTERCDCQAINLFSSPRLYLSFWSMIEVIHPTPDAVGNN